MKKMDINYENNTSKIDGLINTINTIKNINDVIDNNRKQFDDITKSIKSIDAMYNNLISSNTLSSLTTNYINQIKKNLDKINDIKVQDYLSIISDININKIEPYKFFLSTNIKYNAYEISDKLKPIESVISQYIGYAYRKDYDGTIKEAYDKSIISKIDEESNCIIGYIKKINEVDSNFFDDTNALMDLSLNIKNIVIDENGFSTIINYLSKSIYEATGVENNRIFNLNDDGVSSMLLTLKHIRSYYDHSTKHTDSHKIKNYNNYIREKINKVIPENKSDWTKLQYELYIDVRNLLKMVYDILANKDNN